MAVLKGYIKAMAKPRDVYISDVEDIANQTIKHIMKVLMFCDSGTQHHWESEINGHLMQVAGDTLKDSHKAPDVKATMQGFKSNVFTTNPTLWYNLLSQQYRNMPKYKTFDNPDKLQKEVYKILKEFAEIQASGYYLQKGNEVDIKDIDLYQKALKKRKNPSYNEALIQYLENEYKETTDIQKYPITDFRWSPQGILVLELNESDTSRHLKNEFIKVFDNLTVEVKLVKDAPHNDIYELTWWFDYKINEFYNGSKKKPKGIKSKDLNGSAKRND